MRDPKSPGGAESSLHATVAAGASSRHAGAVVPVRRLSTVS
jgi:hypothetical protein